jgi:hypothetical protein
MLEETLVLQYVCHLVDISDVMHNLNCKAVGKEVGSVPAVLCAGEFREYCLQLVSCHCCLPEQLILGNDSLTNGVSSLVIHCLYG